MKKFNQILVTAMLLFTGSVSCTYAQFSFNGVVAHRGGIYNDPAIPENSIAALRETARLGCYAAEIDVHLTADHIVVVNHDHDFMGMDIATHDYAQLKDHKKLSNGESLPTLAEYIIELKKHPALRLWVDIKKSNVNKARDVLAGQYVAEVITQLYASKITEIIAPMYNALLKIKMMNPEIKLYYIGVDQHPETLKYLGFDGVNLLHTRYAKEYDMEEIRKQGLAIGAYVVDDPAIMRDLLKKKVQFITTNKPQVLIDVLRDLDK